jgi:hypothetical protein
MNKLKGTHARAVSEILLLCLSLRGRMNFSQLGRQGEMCEKSYRLYFEKDFDWLEFNSLLVDQVCSAKKIIGFDPSYIPKSGKHTPDLGYFYSGVANKYKKGLEIGNISVIDVNQNTAYHLEAIQTPKSKKDNTESGKTLVDYYAEIIIERAERLEKISKTLVVDGYFAKIKFIDQVTDATNFDVVCRLRDDANLKYLFLGKQKKGRGRKRKHDGKVNVKKIDKRRIKKVYSDESMHVYNGVVYSVGLKRNIKLCYVEFIDSKGRVKLHKMFFSTNLKTSAMQIFEYYKARFQMEFNFRDAKQFTGLNNVQARSKNKLHFHFNACLTAVNIGKYIQRNGIDKNSYTPISISDLKVQFQNRNLLYRIFSIYGFDHELIKLKDKYVDVIKFGSIAA